MVSYQDWPFGFGLDSLEMAQGTAVYRTPVDMGSLSRAVGAVGAWCERALGIGWGFGRIQIHHLKSGRVKLGIWTSKF